MRALFALLAAFAAAEEGHVFDYSKHGQDWVAGTCSSRERQSPVDFKGVPPAPSGKLPYNYLDVTSPVPIANNGRSLYINLAGQGVGGITHDGAWYNLLNVNVHTLSEHTHNGQHYPMELHLVHKRYDSEALLIVAIPVGQPSGGAFLQSGAEATTTMGSAAPLLKALVSGGQLPAPNGRVELPLNEMNALNLNSLLDGANFYEYFGSLTAPPCAETVTWFVRTQPAAEDAAAVTAMTQTIMQTTATFGNWRSAMPLNGRPVAVRTGVREEPIPQAPPQAPAPSQTSREFRAMKWARDALHVARSSASYVRDLDRRLRAAATAHANAMNGAVPDENAAAGAGASVPDNTVGQPIDVAAAAESVADAVARASVQAINRHVQGSA